MLEALADKITALIWAKLETKITDACEEGFKRGRYYGYVEGHEDGIVSGQDDVVRRVAYLYDTVRAKAYEDALTEAGAIDIEEIAKKEFNQIPPE